MCSRGGRSVGQCVESSHSDKVVTTLAPKTRHAIAAIAARTCARGVKHRDTETQRPERKKRRKKEKRPYSSLSSFLISVSLCLCVSFLGRA
jgi:hypothetical protein